MWPRLMRGFDAAARVSFGIAGGAFAGMHDGNTWDVYAGSCVGVSVGWAVACTTRTHPVTTFAALVTAPLIHIITDPDLRA